jgi:mannosyltransferase OCH1-like enzyme
MRFSSVTSSYGLVLAAIFNLILFAWYSGIFATHDSVSHIHSSASPQQAESYDVDNLLRVPGAPSLAPEWLLERDIENIVDNIGSVNGITKLIHQSWKEESLPKKFKAWSDSCRQKHPGWRWVSSRRPTSHPFILILSTYRCCGRMKQMTRWWSDIFLS